MRADTAIITVHILSTGLSMDIEVPLDISAGELCEAVYRTFFPEESDDIQHYYLKAERPIMLLRGSKTLREFGVRDGSVINITR